MPYTIQANNVGINAITGLTAENVQQALEQISGTATYAAGAAGTADAKAVAAQTRPTRSKAQPSGPPILPARSRAPLTTTLHR